MVGRLSGSVPKTYVEWAERWLKLASFDGPSFDNGFADRNEQILELWCGPIPGDYERRGADKRVLGPGRYTRSHRHGKPRPNSEHEVEYQALEAPLKTCFGEKIVDGVNAPPLARDPKGGRRGNVEGDLLLLTKRGSDYRQYLLEVKVGSNHAYAGRGEPSPPSSSGERGGHVDHGQARQQPLLRG